MYYDVIIVGGGLAGLYTAYNLPKHLRVCILEKYTLGGKADTYHDAVMTVEAGAARFSRKHVHLMKLLRDLGLDGKMIPIPSGPATFVSVDGAAPSNGQQLWAKLQKHRKRSATKDVTLGEFAREVLTPEEYQTLVGSFGYSAEFDIMNAADAMRLMEEYDQAFYVLKGGLSQMVHRLVGELDHVDIFKENATAVRYLNRHCIVSTKAGTVYQGRACVMAMPRCTLDKFAMFKSLKPKLAMIKTTPLCRIYAQCPSGMFPKKITTDNDLRFIIPITKNVVLASYTDAKYANRWKKVLDEGGVREVSKKLTADLAELGMKATFKHIKVFYWPEGVGYWGVGADSAALEREFLHPYPEIPVYVCGENYSHEHQQWMEGALNTANKVAALLRKELIR